MVWSVRGSIDHMAGGRLQRQKELAKFADTSQWESSSPEDYIAPTGVSVLHYAYTEADFDPERWLQHEPVFRGNRPLHLSDYDDIIKKMSRRYGFDWRLIAAQVYVESGFQSNAQSHAGALGLMQVMPGTAREMGYDPHMLLLPQVSIAAGCLYDQRMYNFWSKINQIDHRLAFSLASYNAGVGRVQHAMYNSDSLATWQSICDRLPRETQGYVHRIYIKYHFYKKNLIP